MLPAYQHTSVCRRCYIPVQNFLFLFHYQPSNKNSNSFFFFLTSQCFQYYCLIAQMIKFCILLVEFLAFHSHYLKMLLHKHCPRLDFSQYQQILFFYDTKKAHKKYLL
jgi:hypothetical protein